MATARPQTQHEQLQADVCQLLDLTGWSWLHVRRSIGGRRQGWVTTAVLTLRGERTERGWPDLVAWSHRHPGRTLALELKVPPDKLRPEQAAALEDLASAGWQPLVVTRDRCTLGGVPTVGLTELASILATPAVPRVG